MKPKSIIPISAIFLVLLAASRLQAALVPDTLLTTLEQPPALQAGGQQGALVALDGTTVAVAAPREKNPSTGNEDATIRIYRAVSGELLHTLRPDFLGGEIGALAVSGSRVVAGADFFGDVRVFDLSSTNPTAPVLTLSGSTYFGSAVAIEGTTLVVGMPDYPDAKVYVYDLASATPSTPVHILSSPGSDSGFGQAVDLSGSLVAVGDTDFSSGAVFVFDLTRARPTNALHQINAPAALSSSDNFGFAVAIEGSKLVVGTQRDSAAGRAYYYELAGATPTNPEFTCQNPDGDREFGSAVAINETRIFVGSPSAAGSGRHQGRVFGYTFTNAAPVMTFENPTPADDDRFGTAVAAEGFRVVVGAPYDDTRAADAGAAYSYSLSVATPTVPLATLDETPADLGDQLGSPLVFSGAYLAATARGDTLASDRIGTVAVYAASGPSNITRILTLSHPANDSGYGYGHALALDGSRLAVSDPYETADGKVYIHDLAGASPGTPAFTLVSPSPSVAEQFGGTVAVSGDYVAVGCLGPPPGESHRRVYVFDLGSARPRTPVAVLRSPDERYVFLTNTAFQGLAAPQDAAFGGGLALEGTRLAVLENPISLLSIAGRVHVFDLGAADPARVAYTITAPTGTVWYSGAPANTLSLSRSRLAVNSAIAPGRVHVFDLSGASPAVPRLTVTNAVDPLFGSYANLHGPRLVVGGALGLYLYDLRGSAPASPVHVVPENNGVPALFNAYLAVGLPSADIPTLNQGVVRLYGPGTNGADLTLEHSNTVITAGQTLDFGATGPAGAARTVTLRNTGTAPLVVSSLALSGPNAARFSVTPAALAALPPGASADVIVAVLPGAPGTLAATLTPNDNAATTQVLPLAVTVLSYTTDTDGDGLSDGSEADLAALGFNWQTAQPALVSAYQSGANGAGYYTRSQFQALNVNAPLLTRHPVTGLFQVTLGLSKSTNLATFESFPVSSPQVQVNQGKIRILFADTNDAAFYRLSAE